MWDVQRHRLVYQGTTCVPGTTGRPNIGGPEPLLSSLRWPGGWCWCGAKSELTGAALRQHTRQICPGIRDRVATLGCCRS